jgi:hypothetical protein
LEPPRRSLHVNTLLTKGLTTRFRSLSEVLFSRRHSLLEFLSTILALPLGSLSFLLHLLLLMSHHVPSNTLTSLCSI